MNPGELMHVLEVSFDQNNLIGKNYLELWRENEPKRDSRMSGKALWPEKVSKRITN